MARKESEAYVQRLMRILEGQTVDKKMTKEEKTIGSGQYYDTYRDTVYVRVGYDWIKEPER